MAEAGLGLGWSFSLRRPAALASPSTAVTQRSRPFRDDSRLTGSWGEHITRWADQGLVRWVCRGMNSDLQLHAASVPG